MTNAALPHYAKGLIIKGFGRGSKELGIPTANFAREVVDDLPSSIDTGIYFGLAKIDSCVHKMVISIGWNPFYKNAQKSMETHIMHKFDEDLYGKMLSIIILGYLRPEKNFDSLDDLKKAIDHDIDEAAVLLEKEDFKRFYNDGYFS